MRTYGLIGFPLGHSFSRKYFSEKFARENKEEQYLNFELEDINGLPGILDSQPELAGFNVTIPYKQKVIPFLDRLDPVASAAGAVNTVKVVRKGDSVFLEGYNTDILGFWGSIAPLLKPGQRKALILGSGGASRGVQYAFREAGIATLVVSRHPHASGMISYEGISGEIMEEYLIIVNTTPLGTTPHEDTCPPIPYPLVTSRHLLFDLVYNPPETLFLARGRARGATTCNGTGMLLLQAEKAYEIWNSNPQP